MYISNLKTLTCEMISGKWAEHKLQLELIEEPLICPTENTHTH